MDTTLHRIDPARNAFRFYRLALWPDLFGGVSLAREWGRLGQPGKLRLDPFESAEEAGRVLERLSRAKRAAVATGGDPVSEGMRLHDAQGRRKYLTDAERRAFLVAALVEAAMTVPAAEAAIAQFRPIGSFGCCP